MVYRVQNVICQHLSAVMKIVSWPFLWDSFFLFPPSSPPFATVRYFLCGSIRVGETYALPLSFLCRTSMKTILSTRVLTLS